MTDSVQTLQEYAEAVKQARRSPARSSRLDGRVMGAWFPLAIANELTALARARRVTVSDLLREGAERVLVAAANDRKAPQKEKAR